MAKFTACFVCYLPQTMCSRADPLARAEHDDALDDCRLRNMSMPLFYGAFYRAGSRSVIKKNFLRTFRNIDVYVRWIGEPTRVGSTPCIQAITVVSELLGEFLRA